MNLKLPGVELAQRLYEEVAAQGHARDRDAGADAGAGEDERHPVACQGQLGRLPQRVPRLAVADGQ